MFENLIVPLLFSLLIYLYLPAPETNLLGKISTSYTVRLNNREPSFFIVIFSSSIEDLDRRQIEEIGNVKWVE